MNHCRYSNSAVQPPSKSRYICYKLWIEIGNLILSQTLLPPSIDNPHQLQRKHYKTFNYNNIANNQRIWSINVAHSSPTALLHVNLPGKCTSVPLVHIHTPLMHRAHRARSHGGRVLADSASGD